VHHFSGVTTSHQQTEDDLCSVHHGTLSPLIILHIFLLHGVNMRRLEHTTKTDMGRGDPLQQTTSRHYLISKLTIHFYAICHCGHTFHNNIHPLLMKPQLDHHLFFFKKDTTPPPLCFTDRMGDLADPLRFQDQITERTGPRASTGPNETLQRISRSKKGFSKKKSKGRRRKPKEWSTRSNGLCSTRQTCACSNSN
jgi:hypothetical protein